MSDGLTRRGFTRAALIAGAGLWLPALPVAAQRELTLIGHVVSQSTATHCVLELFLTHGGRLGVEVLANAAALKGRFERGGSTHGMLFESAAIQRPRSRAYVARDRRVPLPPSQEVFYDSFMAHWPDELPAGVPALLELGVVLRMNPERRAADERAMLAALSRVRVQASVVRPG